MIGIFKLLSGLNKKGSLQYLSSNQINEIKGFRQPQLFTTVKPLQNQINEIKGLDNLNSLQWLYLSENQINEIKELDNLNSLQQLNLSSNQIKEIKGLDNLNSLQQLELSRNQIQDISAILPFLYRSENPLKTVLKESYETRKGEVNVNGNPLITPPVEIVKQGNEAILNYFKELERKGTERLYEAKMLIVGQPRAGKTSLRYKLLDPAKSLPEEDKTTRGIDIERLHFDIVDEEGKRKVFYYNIWDFGGHQIYQTTHQFFLTQRSLYVLVMDTGKDSLGNDDTTINYWLQVVELLGGGSPLLLIRNEKNQRQVNIDLPQKRHRFDFLKKDYSIDLNALTPNTPTYSEKRAKEFKSLKEDIEIELKRLPLVGFPMPKNWYKYGRNYRA
jgi:GTPase SAR1 family protein